jgi:cyanuric acid amidohydrolase
LALGELKDADVNDSVVAQRMDLFSSVANTSAGGELRNCEILLFGNSERSGGDLRIGHAVLSDVIDAEGVRSAVRQAIGDESAQVEPERIVAIFAKAEAPPNGMLRGRRTTMLSDPTSTTSGTHAPRSARWSPRSPATPRSSCPAAQSTSASRGRRR